MSQFRVLEPFIVGIPSAEAVPEEAASLLVLPRACLQAPEIIYPNRGVNTKGVQLEINWDNQLTKDLAYFAFPGHKNCLVSGKPLEQTNPSEISMDANLFGRRCFRLDNVTATTRIAIDISDDPYFDTFAGPCSMLGEFAISSDDGTGMGILNLNNNTTYHNLHTVAALNAVDNPFYCQWVTSATFRLQANITPAPYSIGSRWNFVAALAGGSNDLQTLCNNYMAHDVTGSVPTTSYDSFTLGARRFTAGYVNPLDGGIAWAGLWKRRLSLGEAATMRSNPYQILRLKR